MTLGILNYFDLFRLPIFLYSEGYQKRTSFIGLLFSFGIYIFLIYSFTQSDFFQKKSPSVVYQSSQIQHAKNIQFNDNVLMVITVADALNRRYIDESIFTIKFKYLPNPTTTIYKTLSPCTPEDVAFNQSLYTTLAMEGSFCLQNKTFNLEGYWDEKTINYVAINIYQCNNQSSKITCKTPEEIDAFFRDPIFPKFFGVLYHDAQIDFYDYNDPIKITYKADYQAIDPSFRKRTTFFLKTAETTTDDGAFFPSLTTESNIMFQSKESDFLLRSSPLDPYAQMLFYASKEEVKCTRKYQNLPEILGSLTGIAHLIMFFCMLISNLATYISTLEKILNRLYIFPDVERKKVKKIKTRKRTRKEKASDLKTSQPLHDNKDNQLFSLPTLTKPKNEEEPHQMIKIPSFYQVEPHPAQKSLKEDSFVLEHYSEIKLGNENEIPKVSEIKTTEKNETEPDKLKFPRDSMKSDEFALKTKETPKGLHRLKSLMKLGQNMHDQTNKNRLKISFLGYLEYILTVCLCMRRSSKHQIISKAEKAFRHDMDIVNIVTKMHDLEKLKIILLNEDQLLLFNYLSKPLITSNEKEKALQEDISHQSNMKMSKLMSFSDVSKTEKNDIAEAFKRINEGKNSDQINFRLMELFDQKVCSMKKKIHS